MTYLGCVPTPLRLCVILQLYIILSINRISLLYIFYLFYIMVMYIFVGTWYMFLLR